MNPSTDQTVVASPGVFGLDDLDGLEAFYLRYGFATLSGALDTSA